MSNRHSCNLAGLTLATGFLLLSCGRSDSGSEVANSEPPLAGQPLTYDGAIGSFKISAHAEPTVLQAEEGLILTVRITGVSVPSHSPRRPQLRRSSEFNRGFHIEDLPTTNPQPQGNVWVFRYRLKPLNSKVKEIPPIRFDYYKPGVVPREKGYRTTYSDSIGLTVEPRQLVGTADVEGPTIRQVVPEEFYHVSEEPGAVLRHDTPYRYPRWSAIILVAVVTPLVSFGCYVFWRLRYPDATRRAQQRRSEAARRALQCLKNPKLAAEADTARATAAIVTEYLHRRFNLPAVDPVPSEVAALLASRGSNVDLAEAAASFFRASNAARFAPRLYSQEQDLSRCAIELIDKLERQPWGSACFLILGLLTFLPASLEMPEDAELLAKAHKAFQEGVSHRLDLGVARTDFKRAAACYQQLSNRGYSSADLFHNQGNAFLLADELPQAILAYRCASRLAPGDYSIRNALSYARDQVVYPSNGAFGRPPAENVLSWLRWISPQWRLAIASVFYVAGFLLITIAIIVRRRWLFGTGVCVALVSSALIIGLAIENRVLERDLINPGTIVAKNGTLLRIGDGKSYPPRYDTTLQAGVEARLLFARNGWFQIELSSGEVGWVPAEAALLDIQVQPS